MSGKEREIGHLPRRSVDDTSGGLLRPSSVSRLLSVRADEVGPTLWRLSVVVRRSLPILRSIWVSERDELRLMSIRLWQMTRMAAAAAREMPAWMMGPMLDEHMSPRPASTGAGPPPLASRSASVRPSEDSLMLLFTCLVKAHMRERKRRATTEAEYTMARMRCTTMKRKLNTVRARVMSSFMQQLKRPLLALAKIFSRITPRLRRDTKVDRTPMKIVATRRKVT
mmetsp:Transcript_19101/g.63988  ORF Transcript_19101/g.63988 Transcript_19101/m.63988 type:complete len:225 (-) Transcript_19101:235-909(-)